MLLNCLESRGTQVNKVLKGAVAIGTNTPRTLASDLWENGKASSTSLRLRGMEKPSSGPCEDVDMCSKNAHHRFLTLSPIITAKTMFPYRDCSYQDKLNMPPCIKHIP